MHTKNKDHITQNCENADSLRYAYRKHALAENINKCRLQLTVNKFNFPPYRNEPLEENKKTLNISSWQDETTKSISKTTVLCTHYLHWWNCWNTAFYFVKDKLPNALERMIKRRHTCANTIMGHEATIKNLAPLFWIEHCRHPIGNTKKLFSIINTGRLGINLTVGTKTSEPTEPMTFIRQGSTNKNIATKKLNLEQNHKSKKPKYDNKNKHSHIGRNIKAIITHKKNKHTTIGELGETQLHHATDRL